MIFINLKKNFRKSSGEMSPLFYSKNNFKKILKKIKNTLCYASEQICSFVFNFERCKKKIDFKQVNKNLFIPVTSKK